MKIIAFYLPQFHEIPENDLWWGKGFTEWTNIKKAKPLYDGHNQPRIPYNNNYYNLLDDNVKKWQVDIAKKHGIYGFCFYHYWFSDKLLLNKPIEQYLKNSKLDLPFCICWANHNWTDSWKSNTNRLLIAQEYGTQEEWIRHFKYLLPFFKDKRYIKVNGNPLFVIYDPSVIPCLNEMLYCWQQLVQEYGFEKIEFAYQDISMDLSFKSNVAFSYNIQNQPMYARKIYKFDFYNKIKYNLRHSLCLQFKNNIRRFLQKKFNLSVRTDLLNKFQLIDYDEIWNRILNMGPDSDKDIPGAFVDWDNTPRKGDKGSVYVGTTPEKFEKYLTLQIRRARHVYKKDMLFIFAWNEWTEGGYLEPDEKYGYSYLEAIRNALIKNEEFPEYTQI